jgi:hypothetical protein
LNAGNRCQHNDICDVTAATLSADNIELPGRVDGYERYESDGLLVRVRGKRFLLFHPVDKTFIKMFHGLHTVM